jgi:uncharacterized protein YqgV (UPF0045/DUF77 family)
MNENSPASILTTVNAPYATYVDAARLADCLESVEAAHQAMGQVYSFFTEVPIARQAEFARTFGVSSASLAKLAEYLSIQSGQIIKPAI